MMTRHWLIDWSNDWLIDWQIDGDAAAGMDDDDTDDDDDDTDDDDDDDDDDEKTTMITILTLINWMMRRRRSRKMMMMMRRRKIRAFIDICCNIPVQQQTCLCFLCSCEGSVCQSFPSHPSGWHRQPLLVEPWNQPPFVGLGCRQWLQEETWCYVSIIHDNYWMNVMN